MIITNKISIAFGSRAGTSLLGINFIFYEQMANAEYRQTSL